MSDKRASTSAMRLVIALAAIALVAAGCKGEGGGETETTELRLYCGAGIRLPADELIEVFSAEHGVTIAPDYRGSEILLSSIKISRRGDLYMPGDRHYVDKAEQAELILSRKPVAHWIPTIVVQKGNPKAITGIEDLLKPEIKTGFGDPAACAIGLITQKIFEKNNIPWEDVEKKLAYKSLNVNDLGTQIQTQSLDAVIIWDSLAQYYSRYADAIPIPTEKNFISGIDIAVLKFTENRELAEKFTEFLTSEKARKILNKHKYATEPPTTP